MAERDELASALFKEFVGPRGGVHEILPANQNPRDEYLSGILEPAAAGVDASNVDADGTELLGGADGAHADDDQDDASQVLGTSLLSPALDPRALPRSIGISFTVEDESANPQFQICATWARYVEDPQGWQRVPSHYVSGSVSGASSQSIDAGDGVQLAVRSVQLAGPRWRVSVYLINRQTPRDPDRIAVHEYVFQPEIRITVDGTTRIVPAGNLTAAISIFGPGFVPSVSETSLAALYRDRPALARGHLCSATWRAIDPQRPHPSGVLSNDPPFFWIDSAVVPAAARARFQLPDVRTEILPHYPVEAPSMDWRSEFGAPPTLNADRLAETWDPQQLVAALRPLTAGYTAWIASERAQVAALPPEQRQLTEANLATCEACRDRIDRGIDALIQDDDARLAFCFANRAIAIQESWKQSIAGRPVASFSWRPFQLAFILMNVPAMANPGSNDRDLCDLLWFPTGGGKTEAYLGLAAFTLGLRRRRALNGDARYPSGGAGVSVLSRYTLRLLTIQQFRRAMGVILACEVLRVWGLDNPRVIVGWRPQQCRIGTSFIWGGTRFSGGLWVGGSVTPNRLWSLGPMQPPGGGRLVFYAGGIDILQGVGRHYRGNNPRIQTAAGCRIEKEGDPAQLTSCPCCGATLAVPDRGYAAGTHTLHVPFVGNSPRSPGLAALAGSYPIIVHAARLTNHSSDVHTVSLQFTVNAGSQFEATNIEEWWYQNVAPALSGVSGLLCANVLRPGYIISTFDNSGNTRRQNDFEIVCPDPVCLLNQRPWAEQVPLARNTGAPSQGGGVVTRTLAATSHTAALPGTAGMTWEAVFPPFQHHSPHIAGRIPIPAFTVDDQLYHRCPSVVIATVDKFARLAYEAKASAFFGNVDHYHSRWGYYREGCPPLGTAQLPTQLLRHPAGSVQNRTLHVPVDGFRAPDLILQDELHLIEGPLGSMVGLYETAVEQLCVGLPNLRRSRPKYVASTATVRQAEQQVEALFDRRLFQFPPSANLARDRFFAVESEVHPLDQSRPGRLYIGIAAPGRGAQTPIVRVWAVLLQKAQELWAANQNQTTDQFFTLVGYFNAIRELAGASALYRQDIPERMNFRWPGNARQLRETGIELSSRTNSLELPGLLKDLELSAPDGPDAVFSTSMFGTGVDVGRLGLMVVHGQPKTTASYIQASGRVGRNAGGLVITFFRASRPRDLDHYELFCGYHRALNRYVEPVTVAPFSPRARERALGPLSVILLRQAMQLDGHNVHADWRVQERLSGRFYSEARRMSAHRHDAEVAAVPRIFERRAQVQPHGRQPAAGITQLEAASELDLWSSIASRHGNPDEFVYYEYGYLRLPQRHVVLGDAQHLSQNLEQAYARPPQSLRDVEDTSGFQT